MADGKVVEFTAIFAVGENLDKAQLVRVTHTRQADGSLLREENRLTPAQARECRMALEKGDLVPDIRAQAAPGRQMLLPKEVVDPSHRSGYVPHTPPEMAVTASQRPLSSAVVSELSVPVMRPDAQGAAASDGWAEDARRFMAQA